MPEEVNCNARLWLRREAGRVVGDQDSPTSATNNQWVSFDAFQKAVGRPPLNVRFAVKALGKPPRRKPGDQRFTQYNLDWADEVRTYLDQLGNPPTPNT
jgi:hypothetical protein